MQNRDNSYALRSIHNILHGIELSPEQARDIVKKLQSRIRVRTYDGFMANLDELNKQAENNMTAIIDQPDAKERFTEEARLQRYKKVQMNARKLVIELEKIFGCLLSETASTQLASEFMHHQQLMANKFFFGSQYKKESEAAVVDSFREMCKESGWLREQPASGANSVQCMTEEDPE